MWIEFVKLYECENEKHVVRLYEGENEKHFECV